MLVRASFTPLSNESFIDIIIHVEVSGDEVPQPPVLFIETPSLGRLPTKAKDPNLAMRHGYRPPDANPVLHDHGDVIIIIIIIIFIIIIKSGSNKIALLLLSLLL